MNGSPKSRGPLFAAVGVVVVVAVIALGFIVAVPIAQSVTYPTTTVLTGYTPLRVVTLSQSSTVIVGTYISSSVSVYQTSSLSYATISEQTTTNQPIFDISSTTLQPNYYVSGENYLPALASVSVSWTTDNSANVYVFTSSEYSAYTASGTTSPSVASDSNTGSGSFSFITTSADSYYLVIDDPSHFLGIGNTNIVVSSSGIASYSVQTATQVAQTNTYLVTTTVYSTLATTSTSTTSIPVTVTTTNTQYTTSTGQTSSTTSCSYPFWKWITGSNKCT